MAIVNTHNPSLTAFASSPFDSTTAIPIEHTQDTPSLFSASNSPSPSHRLLFSPFVPQSVSSLPWYQRMVRRAVDGGGAEGDEGPTAELEHLLKKV